LKEQNKIRKEDKEKRKNPALLLGLSSINSKLKNVASSLNKTVNAVSG